MLTDGSSAATAFSRRATSGAATVPDLAGALRWQPLQDGLEVVGVRVAPVELGGLDQAGDRRRALAGGQRACEQPVLAPGRPGADLLLGMVVVYRQARVVEEVRQRQPSVKAVVDRLGCGRAGRHLRPLWPCPRISHRSVTERPA